MPGTLPDPEEVINKITQRNSKFYVTVDMSYMFFAIPITEDSKEYTTFTWEGARYQFNRLPQGYLNSPVIAHSILASQIDNSKHSSFISSYIDDISMMYDEEHILE